VAGGGRSNQEEILMSVLTYILFVLLLVLGLMVLIKSINQTLKPHDRILNFFNITLIVTVADIFL
jgi:hypothetical protein